MSPDVSLLKTCQTCFRAKIRCRRAGDSGSCDRCLRLDKTCVFRPARRNAGRPRRSGRSEGRSTSDSRSPAPSGTTHTVDRGSGQTAGSTPRAATVSPSAASFDPFSRGLLSLETGQELLDYFTVKMTAHFPFVVLPQSLPVDEMARERPCTCLAVLAAACHGKLRLQRSLGRLLNELIASRVAIGPFHSLDMLQGLLVNVAWAHYQPRPRKHTQHLHLAISILCDMRLDRPRHKPELWEFDKGKYQNGPSWNADEMRAFAGAYYLSSSSSVLMRKSRHFEFTSYMYDQCEHLGQDSQFPTDKHLAYIIGLQKLIEDVDRVMTKDPNNASAEIERVKDKSAEMRASLPFSLHESPPVSMQLNLLELLISQSSLGGSTFGIDKFPEIQSISDRQSHLLEWLSTSISAVQSLISMVLVLPAGEERPVSNTAWLAFYCGMALAVQLDLLAARQGPSGAAHHLRRFLDMPNTLRQVAMRSESAAGDEVDDNGDRDVFHGMASRSRRLEEWYLERLAQVQSVDQTARSESQEFEGDTIAVASSASSGHLGTTGTPSQAADAYAPFDQDHLNTGLYYDADLDFANVLFGDSQGYSIDFERWTTLE